MGPSHPATHGVLRIVLELDGEIITKADPDVGYLHRGDEKIAENMTYTQFIPYTDRLIISRHWPITSLTPSRWKNCWASKRICRRAAQYIRVMCCELARISSHLLGLGAFGLDLGAITVFLLTFTEREKIYNLCESLTGAVHEPATRALAACRATPAWLVRRRPQVPHEVVVNLAEMETLLTRNRIWVDRHPRRGRHLEGGRD